MKQSTISKSELIMKIKQKKEISGISNIIVSQSLEKYSKNNKIKIDNLSNLQAKIIIKEIRSELRKLSGQYKSKKIKSNSTKDLLMSHTSTLERLEFYPKLKKIISSLNPKSILDLGCGLNPLAIAKKGVKYTAIDINEEDLLHVKEHFKKNNISGEVLVYDLRNIMKDLPKVDLCIVFKLLDIINDKKHKTTENVLTKVKCKYFLFSFSSRLLSGKKMNAPRRAWLEKMLKRYDKSYNKFYFKNEIFYLIKNN